MSDDRPNYYAIIPANVRYDNKLTSNAKLLYGEITALCNDKGFCWANNGYFADLYNVTNVTVSKWISELEVNGYILRDIVYKKGTKEILNRYLRIVYDPIKENFNTPIKEKFKDNNTSINNTINNIVPFEEIINYFNLKSNSKFRANSKSTKEHINARFKEKYTFEDFKTVIDKKCNEWLNTDMQQYLTPDTLFSTKFEKYLNQKTKYAEKQIVPPIIKKVVIK